MFIVDRPENRKKKSSSFIIRSLPSCPPISSTASFKLTNNGQSRHPNSVLRIPILYIYLLIEEYQTISQIWAEYASKIYTGKRQFLRNSDATPSKWNVHYNVTNNLDFFKVPRLEGLMLKLKLQYFGHLMLRVDSLEKTLILGGIGGRRRRGRQDEMVGWHHRLDGHEFE